MSRVVIGLCLVVLTASAQFKTLPKDVPFSRVAEKARRVLDRDPGNVEAWYVLGRIHSIALATDSDVFESANLGEEGRMPWVGPRIETFLPEAGDVGQEVRLGLDAPPVELTAEDRARALAWIAELDAEEYDTRAGAERLLLGLGPRVLPLLREARTRTDLSREQSARLEAVVLDLEIAQVLTEGVPDEGAPARRLRHPQAAIRCYERAAEIDPAHALARLGLGWCWERAGRTDRAVEAYRSAWALAGAAELAKGSWCNRMGTWHDSAALEAGERLLVLLGEANDGATRSEVAALRQGTEELKSAIEHAEVMLTPILVPLGPAGGLSDLLAPGRAVRFDLAGDDHPRAWPWVNDRAGILVWDPEGTGEITSGRQMFGSITWYTPWPDGYRPLSYLDADGDGWIRGDERDGLALWRDADADGLSGPGKVRPLREWGLEALSCRGEGAPGEVWCPRGAVFSDGRVVPTWDWCPDAHRDDAHSALPSRRAED